MEFRLTPELAQELALAEAYLEAGLDPPQDAPQPQPARRRAPRVRGFQYRARTATLPVGQSVGTQPAEEEQGPVDHDFAGDDWYQPSSPEPDQNNQLAQQMAELMAAYGMAFPPEQPELQSQHYTDAAAEHAAFAALRPYLLWYLVQQKNPPANDALCASCGSAAATLACLDCGTPGKPRLFCGGCDKHKHPYVHFHRRRDFTCGFYKPIPPEQGHDAAGTPEQQGKHFDMPPAHCLGCHEHHASWTSMPEQAKPIYCIHEGRHRFYRMAYQCSLCHHVQLQGHQELLKCGLWPASPSPERLQYVVVIDTLQEFADLVTHIPKSSMRGFVSLLQSRGERQHGIKGAAIPQPRFPTAYEEFAKAQFELRHTYSGLNDLECPAGSSTSASCDSLHVDANMKLYNWNHRNFQMWRHIYPGYDGVVFAKGSLVTELTAILQAANIGQEKGSSTCGGLMKAADNRTPYHKRFITGRLLCVCRHEMALPGSALNIIESGEKYSWYLIQCLCWLSSQPAVVFWDVCCKGAAWLRRTVALLVACTLPAVRDSPYRPQLVQLQERLDATEFVLPEMHARMHSWTCQLQYSPAFVQGLSGGDGEYAERLNAELSPYNSTVKNMSTAGSQDRITEIVCGIGARKRSAQPHALVLRWSRAVRDTALLEHQLLERRTAAYPRLSDSEHATRLQQLQAALKRIAVDTQARARTDDKKVVAFFTAHEKVSAASQLQPFVNAGSTERRLVAGADAGLHQLHEQAEKLIEQLPANINARSALYKQLVSPQDPSATFAAETDANYAAKAQDCITQVADHHITGLQDRLEAEAAQMRRHHHKITSSSSHAVTHKEKQRLNEKLRQDRKRAIVLVEQYNKLRQYGGLERAELTIKHIEDATFPWASEHGGEHGDVLREVGVFVAMELCSTWNKVQRLQREQTLLLREMNGYLSYFKQQLDTLRLQMAAIPTVVAQPATSQPASPALVLQPTQRYMVQPVDVAEDVSFQQGRLALLRAAAAECEDLLRNALTMFERVPSAERPVELANRLLEQYATEAEPAEDEGIEQLVHDSINDDMEGTI